MSIPALCSEYENTLEEISAHNKKIKQYRERLKDVSKEITDYLIEKDLPGIKLRDNVFIVLVDKPTTKRKTKVEKKESVIELLENQENYDNTKLCELLFESIKGEKIIGKTIKLKKQIK